MAKHELIKKEVEANITKDSKAMEKVFELALKEIEAVLDSKTNISDVTKLACAALGGYSRIKSTEVHNKALEIAMGRSRAVNPQ